MGVLRKNGSWYIDYRADGRRLREKIGPSKTLAEKVLAKRMAAIAEGKFLDQRKVKRYLFREAAEKFLEYSLANKRSSRRDEGMLRLYLLPTFGAKHLDEISPWDVERYKADRKGQLSLASVNRELACMKTIFNKAIQWRMTKENPVRSVKLFKENNRRLRFLMADEMRSVIENCRPHLRPIVITALNTGMRISEILNLRWDEVDFDRAQILVRTSKNGESRHVEMNGLLVETLRQLERRPQNPYVFGSREGNPYNDFRKSFKSALAAAGITDFRFHDLRHTFASHLVMNGVDVMTVKELLGHKTIQMTLRYSHLSQGHKKKAVETLGRILDGHFLDTKGQNAVGAVAG